MTTIQFLVVFAAGTLVGYCVKLIDLMEED